MFSIVIARLERKALGGWKEIALVIFWRRRDESSPWRLLMESFHQERQRAEGLRRLLCEWWVRLETRGQCSPALGLLLMWSGALEPGWSPEAASCSYIVFISRPPCTRGGRGAFWWDLNHCYHLVEAAGRDEVGYYFFCYRIKDNWNFKNNVLCHAIYVWGC